MEECTPDRYGEDIPDVYDTWYPTADQDCVSFLSALAGSGRVLELGIGTGCIALSLKERGIDIEGGDASAFMVAKLKGRPLGATVLVTIGDLASLGVEGQFDLSFVVFSTFFGLTSQQSQAACMTAVAKRLTRNGRFVVEAFVPDLGRFDGGQAVRATGVDAHRVMLDVSIHDARLQQVTSQHVLITCSGIELYPVLIRCAWPSELDVMAEAAGMSLVGRWEDWRKTAFVSCSGRHVSVHGRKELTGGPQGCGGAGSR